MINGRITRRKVHIGVGEMESAAVDLHNHEEPFGRFDKLKRREAFITAVINSTEEDISDIVRKFFQEG